MRHRSLWSRLSLASEPERDYAECSGIGRATLCDLREFRPPSGYLLVLGDEAYGCCLVFSWELTDGRGSAFETVGE